MAPANSLPRTESWSNVESLAALEHSGSKTIIVVDDDPAVLKSVAALLREEGNNILTSIDGKAALELVAKHVGDIDLLLSDFQMPGMNGMELATAMTTLRP